MASGYDILIPIGIMFAVSLIYGLAALRIYEFFLKALREKSRIKLWWAFTSSIFLFFLIVFLPTIL